MNKTVYGHAAANRLGWRFFLLFDPSVPGKKQKFDDLSKTLLKIYFHSIIMIIIINLIRYKLFQEATWSAGIRAGGSNGFHYDSPMIIFKNSHLQVMDIRFASLFVDEGDTRLYGAVQRIRLSRGRKYGGDFERYLLPTEAV
ncbi:hypothetical protein [Paenibacillus contaminans]|nr:hypothetical protein [Paenibacillus contaminans]